MRHLAAIIFPRTTHSLLVSPRGANQYRWDPLLLIQEKLLQSGAISSTLRGAIRNTDNSASLGSTWDENQCIYVYIYCAIYIYVCIGVYIYNILYVVWWSWWQVSFTEAIPGTRTLQVLKNQSPRNRSCPSWRLECHGVSQQPWHWPHPRRAHQNCMPHAGMHVYTHVNTFSAYFCV